MKVKGFSIFIFIVHNNQNTSPIHFLLSVSKHHFSYFLSLSQNFYIYFCYYDPCTYNRNLNKLNPVPDRWIQTGVDLLSDQFKGFMFVHINDWIKAGTGRTWVQTRPAAGSPVLVSAPGHGVSCRSGLGLMKQEWIISQGLFPRALLCPVFDASLRGAEDDACQQRLLQMRSSVSEDSVCPCRFRPQPAGFWQQSDGQHHSPTGRDRPPQVSPRFCLPDSFSFLFCFFFSAAACGFCPRFSWIRSTKTESLMFYEGGAEEI